MRLLPVFRREAPQSEDRGRVERRVGRVGQRPLLVRVRARARVRVRVRIRVRVRVRVRARPLQPCPDPK